MLDKVKKTTLRFDYKELKENPTLFKMGRVRDAMWCKFNEGVWPGGMEPEWFTGYYSEVKQRCSSYTKTEAAVDLLVEALDFALKEAKKCRQNS